MTPHLPRAEHHFVHAARGMIALTALLCSTAHADSWLPTYGPFPGASGSRLGTSIAVRTVVDGGRKPVRLFVGAPHLAAGALAEAGAVLVYVPGPGGWVLDATLRAPTPQAGAHFGASVAMGDPHLIVGAPDYNDVGGVGAGAGRVYFFIDGNVAVTTIIPRGGITGSGGRFGSAVAADGDMAAVAKVDAGGGSGCVSGFRYDIPAQAWQSLPALGNSTCGVAGAALGASLAIRRTGDATYRMVAGAPGESRSGQALAGAAHVFAPNPNTTIGGLIEVGTLGAPDPAFLDVFGTSVGIDANHVYVGASGRDNGIGRVGSVSIFTPNPTAGYDFQAEIFPQAPATLGGHCGAALAIDRHNSDKVVIGCPDSNGTVALEGQARLLRKTTFLGQPVWLETPLTFGATPHGADGLGASLAVAGNRFFVGAPRTDAAPSGVDNGAWYEFNDVLFRNGFD